MIKNIFAEKFGGKIFLLKMTTVYKTKINDPGSMV
jgi:hypothetical protein